MKELILTVMDNIYFVFGSLAIVAAFLVVAKISERLLKSGRGVTSTRRITTIAICGAIATVLHILDFPLLFLAPGFYKLDFSELPVLLCGFCLGPVAAVSCEGIKILLKLLIQGTSTAFVGDLANFVVGCVLVLPAIIIYHSGKSKKTAIVGLVVGTVCLTVFGSIFNALYLLPKFSELYGLPLDKIVGMGTRINSGITDVGTFVFYAVAPLNLIKGASVSILSMLLYKKVAKPLFNLFK